MAKGAAAKDTLMKRFQAACGEDYVGTEDGKKFYFWSSENGERVQVCITMTVPKIPLECNAQGGDLNFEDEVTPAKKPVEMDKDEKATLDRLMKDLGL